MHFNRSLMAALVALTTVCGGAAAQSLNLSSGRLRFTLSPGHNVLLTADGVPVIRESHIYLVSPGWTSTLLNADGMTPTTTSSTANGVQTGTAVYENAEAIVSYTYRLGPDDTYKVTVNYRSKSKPAEVEWDMAYLNANIIAGRPWSASTVQGARSGSVPVYATSADQTASQLCPNVTSIHFDTALGPLDVTIEGSHPSVRSLRIFDARAGTQDWAQRNPIFWFGTGVSPIPTAGQTITATWRLGPAPVRTTVPALPAPPTPRDLATVKVPHIQDFPVIPRPKQTVDPGAPFRMGQAVTIALPANPTAEEARAATELKTELATYWSVQADVTTAPPPTGTPVIELGLSDDHLVPAFPEGYRLNTSADRVVVMGRDPRGLYNGAQTLKQLLRADEDGVYVRSASIRDWPTLPMRGVHWFGGPYGLSFHRKMIDLIVAPYKMNTMLYECEFGKWTSHPEIWSTARGMTKTDIQQSVAYARTHFIEPIPMINSLGHADWLFWNGQHRSLATNPSSPRQYDPENPAVYDILFDVMGEAADIFQPRYFHIGHDEVTTSGTFPKPGSTKTASELMLADIVKINNWVKDRGMQTMMWGDEFLHYPSEATDAGNAPDPATAAARRAGLPDDILITDWHYAPRATYPSINLWKQTGRQVIGVPWFDWTNIENMARSVAAGDGLGLIQSTWAGWAMYPDIVNTSSYHQFRAYLVAAEMAWTGGSPGISALGYNPDDAFKRAWNRRAVDLKSYRGAVVDPGSTNSGMWDWIPGSRPPAPFPSGDQVWGGIAFSVDSPVLMAGALNPAGEWPLSVTIPMGNRIASEVNLLWGTTWFAANDSPVARAKITYSDGLTHEVLCRYGSHIQAFHDLRGGLATSTVWTGKDSAGQNVGLRRWAWTNPRPTVPIAAITLTSEAGEAAPVFLGLTAVGAPRYTVAEAVHALRVAGGLAPAGGLDTTRLNLHHDGAITIADAILLAQEIATH